MTNIHPRVLAFLAFIICLLVAIKFDTPITWAFMGISLGYFAAVNRS